MKRIAKIVLATVLAFTTCLFGLVNTANAQGIQPCTSYTSELLPPGSSLQCSTTGVNTLNINSYLLDPMGAATITVANTAAKSDCSTKTITLNETNPTFHGDCSPSQGNLTFQSVSTSIVPARLSLYRLTY